MDTFDTLPMDMPEFEIQHMPHGKTLSVDVFSRHAQCWQPRGSGEQLGENDEPGMEAPPEETCLYQKTNCLEYKVSSCSVCTSCVFVFSTLMIFLIPTNHIVIYLSDYPGSKGNTGG